MTVKLAKTAGFCYGVRRALGMALSETHNSSASVQTYGPLIHNRQVIDLLKSKNICSAGNISEISSPKILIRAHGVTPEIKKQLAEKGGEILDATCPHVSKAQKILERFSKDGYFSVIVGDKGHAEVVGLLGYTNGRGMVIENIGEIDSIPSEDKICVVAQTTQSEELFNEITKILKERYKNIVVHNTICKATSQRQTELVELAKSVDLMVIVGGKESANTTRLFELSKATGTPTIHIETADELSITPEEAQKYKNIGVTAGASTPYWIIRNVVEELEDLQRQKNLMIIKLLYKSFRALAHSNILLALGAAIMTMVSSKLMNIKPLPLNALISFFYILSMHLLNKRLSLPDNKNLTYGSLKFFINNQKTLLSIAAMSVLGAFITAFWLSYLAFITMILSLFAGIVYGMAIFPQSWAKIIKYRSLKAIPGSKDLFSAIGWVIVVVLLPFFEDYSTQKILPLIVSAIIIFSLMFSRSILLDLRDIEGDITIGRETIPVFIGSEYALKLSQIFLFISFFIPVIGALYGIIPPAGYLLLFAPIYIYLGDYIFKKSNLYHIWYYDAMLDAQFIIAGILSLYI